jgi:hypothetical protein
MSKRLLVTGSRTWNDPELVCRALVAYGQPGDTLLTGGAGGVDAIAERVWRGLGGQRPIEAWPAQWQLHARAAVPIRNQQMIDSLTPESGIGLAFIRDRSRGASQCARAAERAGITVVRYER